MPTAFLFLVSLEFMCYTGDILLRNHVGLSDGLSRGNSRLIEKSTSTSSGGCRTVMFYVHRLPSLISRDLGQPIITVYERLRRISFLISFHAFQMHMATADEQFFSAAGVSVFFVFGAANLQLQR